MTQSRRATSKERYLPPERSGLRVLVSFLLFGVVWLDDDESSGEEEDKSSSSDDGESESEEEELGTLAQLGLRPEFMPVAQRAWELEVCLKDSSDEDDDGNGNGNGSNGRVLQGR